MSDHATFPEQTMLDLMAFADGELEGDDLARVEKLLAESPEAARVVESMRTLGACIMVAEEQRRVPKIVDRIVDDVMERLPEKVVPLPRPVRLRNAFVAGGVSMLMAAAVVWALFFRAPEALPEHHEVAHNHVQPQTSAPHAPATVPSIPRGGTGVDLDQVESSMAVSVFTVGASGDDDGTPSLVVWVGDDSPAGGH